MYKSASVSLRSSPNLEKSEEMIEISELKALAFRRAGGSLKREAIIRGRRSDRGEAISEFISEPQMDILSKLLCSIFTLIPGPE